MVYNGDCRLAEALPSRRLVTDCAGYENRLQNKESSREEQSRLPPERRIAGSRAVVLLAARWLAEDDDRVALKALSGALPETGVDARLWRPLEDSLADCRCLHLFGTAAEFLPVVESARQNGVKVVLSPEIWQMGESGPIPAAGCRIRRPGLPQTGRWLTSRTPAWQRELYASVDLLLPNSNTRGPADRSAVQARAGPVPRRSPRCGSAFGRGRSRALLPPCWRAGFRALCWFYRAEEAAARFPLGHEGSGRSGGHTRRCRAAMSMVSRRMSPRGRSQRAFLPRLPGDDPRLASAYAACGCLVVANGVAAPERIALAAGASGTPLVLFEGGAASEYFGQQAIYIRPDDVAGIRRGVQAALDRKRSKNLAEHVCTYFSWKAAAKALRDVYGQVSRMPRRQLAEPLRVAAGH